MASLRSLPRAVFRGRDQLGEIWGSLQMIENHRREDFRLGEPSRLLFRTEL